MDFIPANNWEAFLWWTESNIVGIWCTIPIGLIIYGAFLYLSLKFLKLDERTNN